MQIQMKFHGFIFLVHNKQYFYLMKAKCFILTLKPTRDQDLFHHSKKKLAAYISIN